MKSILIFAASATLAFSALACQEHLSAQGDAQCSKCSGGACAAPAAVPAPAATSAPATAPAHVEIPTTGVRTIALPAIQTELPPGPGKLTLVSACTICHTPRYVTMQPNFSRKKWTEEVEKMKKVYGAPLQDEQVEPIVNYLVSIRGNGQ